MKTERIVNGYRVIYRPDHFGSYTKGNWVGWIFEHRYIVESQIGRKLGTDEFVHHINGDKLDNRPTNLRLCDRASHGVIHHEASVNRCPDCGKRISHRNKHCILHREGNTIPSFEQLKSDISGMTWVSMGKKYGVTDNAVKKWARKYGLL